MRVLCTSKLKVILFLTDIYTIILNLLMLNVEYISAIRTSSILTVWASRSLLNIGEQFH